MTTCEQVREWLALADAVLLRDTVADDASLESIARTVAFERAASRTAVPAMADMLERAAKLLGTLATIMAEADLVLLYDQEPFIDWLAEWRGEVTE